MAAAYNGSEQALRPWLSRPFIQRVCFCGQSWIFSKCLLKLDLLKAKPKQVRLPPFRRSASLKRKLIGICSRGCLLLCILLSTPLWPATAQVLRREAFALRNATQLIVVATPEWNAMFGVLQRYERSAPGGTWKVVGHPIAVVIGKNGLGWEAGNDAADPRGARSPNDPVKQEGDLRSPAGVFLSWHHVRLLLPEACGLEDALPRAHTFNRVCRRPKVEVLQPSARPGYSFSRLEELPADAANR